MSRLDQDRQARLEPTRMHTAIKEIQARGLYVHMNNGTTLQFNLNGHTITYYPYSGWATGKGITDGRGLNKLLAQLEAHDMARRPVKCNCPAGLIQGHKGPYARKISLPVPPWLETYEYRRRHGLSDTLDIDICIANHIRRIWAAGIDIVGCCCGCGVTLPWVEVHHKYERAMFALGYGDLWTSYKIDVIFFNL